MPAYDHKSKNVVDGSKFNGANAAGGFRTTAGDLATFMEEGFKGFPGTKEYKDRVNNPNQNPYFTDTTIDRMMAEGKKFGIAGANQKAGTVDYQMSGFVATVRVPEGLYIPDTKPVEDGGRGESLEDFNPTPEQLDKMFSHDNIDKYAKTGGIVGAKTFAEFNPATGEAEIQVFLKEDVTPQIDRLKEDILLQSKIGRIGEAEKALEDAKNLSSQIGVGEKEFLEKSTLELQSLEREVIHQKEMKGLDQKLDISDTSWVDRISSKELGQLKQLGESLPKMESVESDTEAPPLSHVEKLNKSLEQDDPQGKGGR